MTKEDELLQHSIHRIVLLLNGYNQSIDAIHKHCNNNNVCELSQTHSECFKSNYFLSRTDMFQTPIIPNIDRQIFDQRQVNKKEKELCC